MRSVLSLAFGGAATVVLLLACGGSSGVTSIPDLDTVDGSTVDTGGSNTDGDVPDPTDSGVVCAPCQTPPPSSACKGTGPCGCAPYTCPDGGGNPADAGSDAATDNSCTWSADSNPCGPGKYCRAAMGNNVKECGKGVCVALGTNESPLKDSVCGCDGLTYWNSSIAAKRGVSVRGDGPCTGGDAQACGGVAGTSCSNGAKCNYRTQEQNCKTSDPSGTCWMLPATCVSATKGRTCSSQGPSLCSSECTLIKGEEPWYASNLCQP